MKINVLRCIVNVDSDFLKCQIKSGFKNLQINVMVLLTAVSKYTLVQYRAARYSKINLDIALSCANIQNNNRVQYLYTVFDIISRLWCQECKESCLVLKIT